MVFAGVLLVFAGLFVGFGCLCLLLFDSGCYSIVILIVFGLFAGCCVWLIVAVCCLCLFLL